MRFPWLQVDADFIAAHAGDLGAHLGISRREAMGLALDLWTWALARAPDDAPPDGVVTGTGTVPDRLLSGSVGWTGPVEQFTEALVGCGLAVRIDGGYRLTGFSRYKATWEKNRRRSGAKPERNRSGSGEEPPRKTQTQTQKATTASQETSPVSDGGFELTSPTSKKRSRQPSAAEAMFTTIQATRKQRCEDVGEPFVAEEWPAQRQNRDLKPILAAENGLQARFEAAWGLYLADDGQRARTPAWSFAFFMSSGVRAKYETMAAREEAA